jgi:hypothetical protein
VVEAAQLAETVVVAGSLAQKDEYAGHTWFFLQYLLGFRRLGFEVLFIDWLSPEMCGGPVATSRQAAHLAEVMESFDLAGSYSLLVKPGGETIGLPRDEALERVRRSVVLLNVMGYLDDEELLAAAPLRVFLDIDPGFPQMWRALGLADVFEGHDVCVTIGENIGNEDCAIPTCGLDWKTTRQPVFLERWPVQAEPGRKLTTVGSWRGPNGPVSFEGTTYGLRAHEFRRFANVPSQTGRAFEAALDIDPSETTDLDLLAGGGWRVVDPGWVAGNVEAYRRYIQRSRAEFSVAKHMYVETSSGWFSDRSVCYLASGRPVLALDTGLAGLYPCGEGLLVYTSEAEAVDAVEELFREPERHATAARRLAEGYFDSDVVLPRLLETVGA